MSDPGSSGSIPPFHSRLLYHIRLVRLGREWQEWVERDVARPSFVAWDVLFEMVCLAVVVALIGAVTGEIPFVFAGVWALVRLGALTTPWGRRFSRDAVIRAHRRKWARTSAA